jgi:shikimate kinase
LSQNQLIKEKSAHIIFLVGFMGCGKTTIGKLIAEKLNYHFLDSDDEIEKSTKLSIPQIFNEFGEHHFRELEADFIEKSKGLENTVISTGGGLPCFNNQIDQLLEIGFVVFIDTSIQQLLQRIQSSNRPLISNVSEDERINFVENLLKTRRPIYERANLIVNGTQTTELIVNEILAKCQTI